MNDLKVIYWINTEIPEFLDKFFSYEDFDNIMPSCSASYDWKVIAYAMAKERWNVETVVHIPR